MTPFAPFHMFGFAQTEAVMTLATTLIVAGLYLLAVKAILNLFRFSGDPQ